MSANAREALRLLIASLEEHLEAVASRRGPSDAAVDDAYEGVATAFEKYEEALDLEFAEGLPIVLDEDDESDEDEFDDSNDDDDDSEDDEDLDPHAVEDDDEMDDDIEEFDLRS